nr:sel1 repeat domain-containing protein [Cryptomonas curvata]
MNENFLKGKFSDNIKKKIIFKRKKLLISALAICLSCLFISTATAGDFSRKKDDSLKQELKITEKEFHFNRFPIKTFGNWVGLFRNNNKILATKKRFKKICLNKRTSNLNNLLKKNSQYDFKISNPICLGEMVEKITESDRWGLKNSKLNLGEILLYRINLINIKSDFFSLSKDSLIFEENSTGFESIKISSRFNPEIQSSSALLYTYPELSEFNSLKNYFLLDVPKGFVEAGFSDKSGCKLSNNLKSDQKWFGYYSKKNIFYSQNYYNQSMYKVVSKNLNRKKKNKKFKTHKFLLINNCTLKKKIDNFYLNKKRIKKNFELKELVTFDKTYNKNEILLDKKISIHKLKTLKKNLFFSTLGIKKKFFVNDLVKPTKFPFFFKKKKQSRRVRLNFGKKRAKSTFTLNDLNTFRLFPFNQLKLRKRFFVRSVLLNSYSSFSLHLMKNFKKSFIHYLPILRKKTQFEFKNVLESIKDNNSISNFKRTITKKNNIHIKFCKCIFSKKFFLYSNEKNDNVLFPYCKNFIFFKDVGGLNFLGKSFSNGLDIPKSFSESYKIYIKSSCLGNPEAQFNLSEMYFYGKGVERNKKLFFVYSKSSSLREFMPSLFNLIIILKKGIETNFDNIRTFMQVKKFTGIQFKRKKKTKKTKKTFRSNIFFLNIRKPTEIFLIKNFIYSVFTPTHSMLSGFMQAKQTLTSFALKNFKIASTYHSFSSGLRIGDILLENGQIFLSIESVKEYHSFNSSWKDLYFIFESFMGNGFLPDYSLLLSYYFRKSKNFINLFVKFVLVFVRFFYYIDFLLFSVKFFLTIQI